MNYNSLMHLAKLKQCQYCCVMGKCISFLGKITLETMLSGVYAPVPLGFVTFFLVWYSLFYVELII